MMLTITFSSNAVFSCAGMKIFSKTNMITGNKLPSSYVN